MAEQSALKAIADTLRRIFTEEETSMVGWSRRHKLFVFGVILGGVATCLFLSYPAAFLALGDRMGPAPMPLWGGLLLIAWLLVLTYFAYLSRESAERSEFHEDFRRGLDQWEYNGAWRTEKEDGRYILTVTESFDGGIAMPCVLWRDYDFQFETKIVRGNTTWLIRAKDILNYVMLQCGQSELNPHFRVNGMWVKLPPVSLPVQLPVNTWFGVRITVQGTRVIARATVGKEETEIYNGDLLSTGVRGYVIGEEDSAQRADLILSYMVGSIGFREASSAESAHFRNVHVRKI